MLNFRIVSAERSGLDTISPALATTNPATPKTIADTPMVSHNNSAF